MLSLCLPVLRTEAQPKVAAKKKLAALHLQEGNAFLERELYFEASQLYEKAAKLDPENLTVTYYLAECYRLTFNYEQAEKGYGKTVYSQSKDFPLALFYYALMQKMNGKYDEAADNFSLFIQETSPQDLNSQVLMKRAMNEKAGCEMALQQKTLLRRNYEYRILPPPLNTSYHDYAPVNAGVDSLLVITSSRPGSKGRIQDTKLGEALSDFYRFESQDSFQTWQQSRKKDFFESINTKWGEGSGSFNRTCDKFYFTSCQHSESHCEIFVTQLKNGKWQEPVKLNRHINTPGYDSRHPALSPGGDTLFFASNRPNGAGMNDLWMSTTAGSDNWGPAINLGTSINTPLNDLSPFFDEQEKVLFFASDGHKGLGGLDVFIAKKEGSETWKVVNLGPPFNSNMDDAFLTLGRTKGYMASNRLEGVGNFDIYTFDVMSTETAIASLNRSALTGSPDLAYLRDFRLDYFPSEDQMRVDRLVNRKRLEQIYQAELSLTAEEKEFNEHLSSEEKKRINQAASHLLSQTPPAAQHELRSRDNLYYQLLSPDEQLQIDRMAESHRQAVTQGSPLTYSGTDARYYEGLSQPEKKFLDGIIASRLVKKGPENDSSLTAKSQEEQFNYEKLPLNEKSRIDRMAAARLARLQGNEEASLSESDEQYYAALSKEQKAELDRLVEARIAVMVAKEKAEAPLPFDYQQLPLEDQNRINRIAAARRAAQQNNRPIQLSEEDELYYTHLSTEEKAKIDRLIDAKVNQLASEGFNYYQLPLDERMRIDRIVAARRAAQQNNQPVQLSAEDQQYYDRLSDGDRMKIEMMVAAPQKTLTSIRANPRPLAPKSLEKPAPKESVHTFHTGNFESISLKGQVLQAANDVPAQGLEILLVNEAGTTEKSTVTNADGRYQFVQLVPDHHYSVLINEPAVRMTVTTSYRIQNLQLLGYDKKLADVAHEPIYFDFNRFTIRPEAKKVLESLIALCRSNPDMQVEINAFTDAIGSEEYNLELSRKRGREVQQYLIAHEINPNAVVMKYKGKDPVSYGIHNAAGRQANRRVDFILKGAPTTYQSDIHTYITQSKTTLSSLAEAFKMTVQELKELNDFSSNTIDAYRPVRIRNHRMVVPALLLKPAHKK
jgi:outer membrane protein OmpA-like peptidoglycan-associated protein